VGKINVKVKPSKKFLQDGPFTVFSKANYGIQLKTRLVANLAPIFLYRAPVAVGMNFLGPIERGLWVRELSIKRWNIGEDKGMGLGIREV
jgi:hypothetical protein